MGTSDHLLDEIETLLSRRDGRDDPARLERTLTDGYARALAIEAERSRLQKKIGQMTSTVEKSNRSARQELSTLVKRLETREEDLDHLRELLASLRSRYSAATHGKTA